MQSALVSECQCPAILWSRSKIFVQVRRKVSNDSCGPSSIHAVRVLQLSRLCFAGTLAKGRLPATILRGWTLTSICHASCARQGRRPRRRGRASRRLRMCREYDALTWPICGPGAQASRHEITRHSSVRYVRDARIGSFTKCGPKVCTSYAIA